MRARWSWGSPGPRFPSFLIALLASGGLLSGCASVRVVPVPAAGVTVDAGTVTIEGDGIRLAVQPSAWAGSPAYLPSYVTPFRVTVRNGTAASIAFDYPDLKLFDDARFQYTALPPVEVERILRSAGFGGPRGREARRPGEGRLLRLAATVEAPSQPVLRRRVVDPFFWDPWWWAWPPYPYPYVAPRMDDVYLQALRVGSVEAGAQVEGFVYFPRLRAAASRLAFEFHYRLGAVEGVLAVPLRVERGDVGGHPVVL